MTPLIRSQKYHPNVIIRKCLKGKTLNFNKEPLNQQAQQHGSELSQQKDGPSHNSSCLLTLPIMCITKVAALTRENLAQWDVAQAAVVELKRKASSGRSSRKLVSKSSIRCDGSRSSITDSVDAKIFPQHLMEVLENEENHEAINWLPHGKAFMILDREKFGQDVLHQICRRKTKFSSFTRKLRRWNFTRVTRGPEMGAYYHEYFQRGEETLCTQMYCQNARSKYAEAQDKNRKGKAAVPLTLADSMLVWIPPRDMTNGPMEACMQMPTKINSLLTATSAFMPQLQVSEAAAFLALSAPRPSPLQLCTGASENQGTNASTAQGSSSLSGFIQLVG